MPGALAFKRPPASRAKPTVQREVQRAQVPGASHTPHSHFSAFARTARPWPRATSGPWPDRRERSHRIAPTHDEQALGMCSSGSARAIVCRRPMTPRSVGAGRRHAAPIWRGEWATPIRNALHAHSQCLARPPAHRVRRPGRQRRALHAASDAAEQPRGGPQARRSHLPTAPTSPPHPPSHRSHLAVALTWLRPPPGCGSCLAIAPTWPQLSPSHSPHLATALTWPRLPPGHGSHLPPSPPSPPPPSPPSLPPPRPRRRSRRRRREWAQWQQRRPRRAWPRLTAHDSQLTARGSRLEVEPS